MAPTTKKPALSLASSEKTHKKREEKDDQWSKTVSTHTYYISKNAPSLPSNPNIITFQSCEHKKTKTKVRTGDSVVLRSRGTRNSGSFNPGIPAHVLGCCLNRELCEGPLVFGLQNDKLCWFKFSQIEKVLGQQIFENENFATEKKKRPSK